MVAQASPVFDRMMDNGMKETEAGVADLPEVEPETFLTFINLAFHAAGAQRDVSEPGALAAINSVVVGPLIVLSIDAVTSISHVVTVTLCQSYVLPTTSRSASTVSTKSSGLLVVAGIALCATKSRIPAHMLATCASAAQAH